MLRVNRLFSPVSLTIWFYIPMVAIFLAVPRQFFLDQFHSGKAYSPEGLLYYAAFLGLFALGAVFGQAMGGRPSHRETGEDTAGEMRASNAAIHRLIEISLYLCILSYLYWFGLGISRAGGVAQLISVYLTQPFLVKATLMKTVSGLTTLTQLGVAAIPLAISLGATKVTRIRILVVVVYILATIRAFLFSERLALLELIVPAMYLYARGKTVPIRKILLYSVLSVGAVTALFTVAEFRRTGVSVDAFSVGDAVLRMLGYYLTSINNAFLAIGHYMNYTPMFWTFQMIWLFPGASQVGISYQNIVHSNVGFLSTDALINSGLNPEYMVYGVPGNLATDFGWAALMVGFALGMLSGRLYRSASRDPLSRAFYGVWLVGLMEFLRIFYFVNTRMAPAYVMFALVLLSSQRQVRFVRGAPLGSARR